MCAEEAEGVTPEAQSSENGPETTLVALCCRALPAEIIRNASIRIPGEQRFTRTRRQACNDPVVDGVGERHHLSATHVFSHLSAQR